MEENPAASVTRQEGTSTSLFINLAAGGMAGLCVVIVGYPFDLLKTRLQTAHQAVGQTTRLLPEIQRIWRSTGWRGFYQGATAPILAVTPIFAVNFYGYELGKRLYDRLFRDGISPQVYSARKCAFGATFSALQTALIVIPADRIKVYMQLPRFATTQGKHHNALMVGYQLWRDGGIKALFRGSISTLTRDVPGLVTFFTSYDYFKRLLVPPSRMNRTIESVSGIVLAGGLAGTVSWMVSLPSDVLKSRVQAAQKGDPIDRSRFPTLRVLIDLLRNEGPWALYRGVVPVLLRAFPANAACFLGFEFTKNGLEKFFHAPKGSAKE